MARNSNEIAKSDKTAKKSGAKMANFTANMAKIDTDDHGRNYVFPPQACFCSIQSGIYLPAKKGKTAAFAKTVQYIFMCLKNKQVQKLKTISNVTAILQVL